MNICIAQIVGRLTKPPETKSLQNGTVCNLSVASSVWKGGEEKTVFWDVAVWGKQGENCQQHLVKGQEVYVTGDMSVREYTNNNGENKYALEINSSKIAFGAKPKNAEGQTAYGQQNAQFGQNTHYQQQPPPPAGQYQQGQQHGAQGYYQQPPPPQNNQGYGPPQGQYAPPPHQNQGPPPQRQQQPSGYPDGYGPSHNPPPPARPPVDQGHPRPQYSDDFGGGASNDDLPF